MRPSACIVLLLALPVAFAHPGDEFETIYAERDGVAIYMSPQTLVVKAQRDVDFTGEAYVVNGTYTPMTNATFTFDAVGPGEASAKLLPFASGFAARVNFSNPGAWRLLVSANDSSVELPIEVYPASSLRAESSALRYDLFYAEKPVTASLYFVDDANGSLVKKEATVTARIERWENETKLGEEIVTVKPGRSTGDLSFEHTFEREGTYRVRVASVDHGIGYDDLPPFKVNVLAARFGLDEPRETSASPLLVLLAACASVALLRKR